jgi:acyl carrier protein
LGEESGNLKYLEAIMGLEIVELVLATEKTFGVKIPDADACAMQTPGDLADWVAAHVRTDKNAPCLSQARFYRLRALLMETSGVSRKKIRPATPLAELLREDALRAFWARLDSNASRLPGLELPPAFQAGVTAINFCIPLALALYLGVKTWNFLFFPITWFVLFIATSFLTYRLTQRKRVLLPRTLRHDVAALLPFIEVPSPPVWTRETILERIILEISAICGVSADDIGEHTRFVEDIGMG